MIGIYDVMRSEIEPSRLESVNLSPYRPFHEFSTEAVPMSELCHFWRYDLLTHGGISDYYQPGAPVRVGANAKVP